MTTISEVRPWDFSHVLDLVQSLSTSSDPPPGRSLQNNNLSQTQPIAIQQAGAITAGDSSHSHDDDVSRSLGDFGKLWDFLGAPRESTPVQPSRAKEPEQVAFVTSTNYTSDGALESIFSKQRSPGTRQKKQVVASHTHSGTDEQDGDTLSDGSSILETPTLTKTQRKKLRRKERRAEEAARLEEIMARHSAAAVSENEAHHVARSTPAKKAGLHAVSTPPPTRKYNLRPRDSTGKAICASEPHNLPAAVQSAVERFEAAKKGYKNGFTAPQSEIFLDGPIPQSSSPPEDKSTSKEVGTQVRASKPPLSGSAANLVPASVQPITKSRPPNTIAQPVFATPTNRYDTIRPIVARSGEDRHWALLIKLISDFYEDRKYLISPMNLTTHNNDPKGIHVFVDASNIFIGFNEQLKRSRGIPLSTHMPAAGLSFDALALLMERRRPVAKRVLVGSMPHLPAFDKAKAVGYECNILEKVYKARELTERQVFFKEIDRGSFAGRKSAKAPPANNVATAQHGSGSGSSSETTAPQYAPARMIEQGVDEILHLKILESVVDADEPSTIVLATGDAAQAEYSEGFMAMAERALKKGWTVELVSWSKTISQMYTRRAWTAAWGERFRIISLDSYAEELLDM